MNYSQQRQAFYSDSSQAPKEESLFDFDQISESDRLLCKVRFMEIREARKAASAHLISRIDFIKQSPKEVRTREAERILQR